jgi:inosine-uridine nucleoside N-ribohydrolase
MITPKLFRVVLALVAASCAQAAPIKIIFDTDIGNDVDDVLALGLIHTLQKRGKCELLAVTVTKDHPQAAPFVDAINTFYGRPGIPIGVVRGGVTRDAGKFNLLAEEKNADGTLRFPHDLKSGADAPEAVDLLRKTLALQPDGSVTLVQVGFFTNYARLLDSPADGHSPLSGRELVRTKVKVLSVMAGAFQPVKGTTRFLEYNVVKDIPSAQKLANDWPTPIVWSGFEIGLAVTYPHESIERDFDYAAHHPLREAYILYNPPPHDRPTWDLTAALWAILPDRDYFDLSSPGAVMIENNGATWFRTISDGGGRDRFLILDALKVARIREAMVLLCSEPK